MIGVMEEVAKSKEHRPVAPPAGTDAENRTTTWKVREKIARILRKIQAYAGGNQEAVLDLFEKEFDDHLAMLQARDIEDRKRRSGG